MSAHDWFVEHRMEFATRVLDADEIATFEAHLASCADCRREVSSIEAELAWLPMGLPPAAPRPGLRRRIIEGVLDHGGRRRRWLAPLAVAASVLLAFGGWAVGRGQAHSLETTIAELEQRTAALADTLSVIRRAERVLQSSVELGGRRGGLVIFADETSHRWSVVLHGLPPAPSGSGYQFWFICTDGMVRGSTLLPAAPGSLMFTTGMPQTGGAVVGAALTLEPVGGATGPPQGRTLVHLML